MSWISLNLNVDKSGSSPWHILDGSRIVVRNRHEMAIHGELLIEGDIQIEETGRIRLES